MVKNTKFEVYKIIMLTFATTIILISGVAFLYFTFCEYSREIVTLKETVKSLSDNYLKVSEELASLKEAKSSSVQMDNIASSVDEVKQERSKLFNTKHLVLGVSVVVVAGLTVYGWYSLPSIVPSISGFFTKHFLAFNVFDFLKDRQVKEMIRLVDENGRVFFFKLSLMYHQGGIKFL
jgi:hypothetical protein